MMIRDKTIWKKVKNKTKKLYLVFMFDFMTAEPVPIVICDWEHAKLIDEHCKSKVTIVPYELNEIDYDTIKNYKFRFPKIPGWDFPENKSEKEET